MKTKALWRGKGMHVQLPRTLDEKFVDIEQSYRWLKLKSGNIKGETESTIVAAGDQAISTNYFKDKIVRWKLTVNTGFVNNMKKLLTTYSQVAPFWRRMDT